METPGKPSTDFCCAFAVRWYAIPSPNCLRHDRHPGRWPSDGQIGQYVENQAAFQREFDSPPTSTRNPIEVWFEVHPTCSIITGMESCTRGRGYSFVYCFHGLSVGLKHSF